jgi:hypothetical protein
MKIFKQVLFMLLLLLHASCMPSQLPISPHEHNLETLLDVIEEDHSPYYEKLGLEQLQTYELVDYLKKQPFLQAQQAFLEFLENSAHMYENHVLENTSGGYQTNTKEARKRREKAHKIIFFFEQQIKKIKRMPEQTWKNFIEKLIIEKSSPPTPIQWPVIEEPTSSDTEETLMQDALAQPTQNLTPPSLELIHRFGYAIQPLNTKIPPYIQEKDTGSLIKVINNPKTPLYEQYGLNYEEAEILYLYLKQFEEEDQINAFINLLKTSIPLYNVNRLKSGTPVPQRYINAEDGVLQKIQTHLTQKLEVLESLHRHPASVRRKEWEKILKGLHSFPKIEKQSFKDFPIKTHLGYPKKPLYEKYGFNIPQAQKIIEFFRYLRTEVQIRSLIEYLTDTKEHYHPFFAGPEFFTTANFICNFLEQEIRNLEQIELNLPNSLPEWEKIVTQLTPPDNPARTLVKVRQAKKHKRDYTR